MRAHLCGTRGSTPAPGADFTRYGGHTSCVALAHDEQVPTLVLDAGTGIREVGALLDGRAFEGMILLTHLHWDHTHGLPFFRAGDHPDARVALYLPAQEEGGHDALARAMSPPSFPIRPAQLRGRWCFDGLEEGQHEFGGFRVLAREIPHKGGRTFGYRVDDGRATLAYLPDHHPLSLGPGPEGLGAYHEAACALAEGVDVLLHDAQHTAAEFAAVADFGHSAIEYAVGLAARCAVRRLVLFHHDPPRTDDQLDAILEGLRGSPVPVSAARDGAVLHLPEPG